MRTLLTTLHSKYIHASLALPSLVAYCGPDCGELLIREFTVHEPKEQVLAALIKEEPDVVAFSVYLWNRNATLELADALAVALPQIRVVFGGPEVIADGAELFARHPGVSAVIHGEGELPLRALLAAWAQGDEPSGVPRLSWRRGDEVQIGVDGPVLADLDALPSPFAAGLVDLSRGLVYYETSRGCPYACAFCMSARDEKVRSFSPGRIEADLKLLLAAEVPLIKFVDRTFNYDGARSRAIWDFILRHNRKSHFHFEIGAHLLDAESLALLASVPPATFQFEIGVQSTLPATLAAIGRRADLATLEANVRALRAVGNIPVHLDLIFGLPGEGYADFLVSLDRVAALHPDHLQLEPVKLLPGSPLRDDAARLGLRFDPHPPYSVLATPDLDFAEIERLRGISRLLDLTLNSGRANGLLAALAARCGSLSAALAQLESSWRRHGLFRQLLAQRDVFAGLAAAVREAYAGVEQAILLDLLARDWARRERLVPGQAPELFDTALTEAEATTVQARVRQESAALRGRGVKLQHFAALFHHLPETPGRQLRGRGWRSRRW